MYRLNFFEKSKRFFSPMSMNKLVYIKWIWVYLVWAFDRIIHVIFLERIVYYLESWISELFYFVVKIYLFYIFLYSLIQVFTRKFWWPEISDTAIKFIQNIYLKKFINLNNNHIEKYWTGNLTAIINKWIDKWWMLLDSFLMQSTNILVSFLFTAYMLYKNNSMFLLIFIIIYIVIYVWAYFLNLWALKIRRKRRDIWNMHTKNLVKIIMNKQEILQLDKINHELEILDDYKNKEIFYSKKISNFLQPLYEWPNVILSLVIIWLLLYLGRSYFDWNIAISWIVWVLSALIVMKSAVEKWIDFFKNFTKEFTDIEKIWEFFDKAPMLKRYNKWKKFIYKSWSIKLKDISYSYIKWKKVLDNFSLKIEWWNVIALVWNSWGGKSTIAKLIWWYIEYKEWQIEIDNQELSHISLKSYYKNIWYLTQEPSIFDWTVLENLTYAVDANFFNKDIDRVIKMAKCEFIYDLPNWLDTEIWERWVKLSWWQRQRLAIAKIMLKDPKIIILDEPTSALDSFSEEQITKAMNNLFKWRTVIVIAHRLQTVKHADKIFLIENWKIVEKWTHKELIKKKWIYNRMLELQSWF